ncbi:MAG: hypothetical protein ACW97P_10965 [Candidatus Hodarchaeales archaeon]|jgi:hypothetical protein
MNKVGMMKDAPKSVFLKAISSTFLALVAIIISIISLCRDCSQDEELLSYRHSRDAYLNPPQLKIGIPKDSLEYQWGFESEGYENIGDTVSFEIKMWINTGGVIQLINEGSSTAHIVGEVIADTSSGKPILRTYLLDEEKRNQCFDIVKPTELFFSKSILANDSLYIPFKHNLTDYISNSMTVLHIVVFYKNDMGALYDSYCFQEINFKYPFEKIGIKESKGSYAPIFTLPDYPILVLGNSNLSLYTYTFKQKEEIMKWVHNSGANQ